MAIITTTIKEPKTFQQIQDQENELGKTEAMERLNENVAKLIQTINEKEKKKETDQDRQLKINQLELSKLQLRRAQLGLAKDEKYYQDYSRKWNEKNNVGTSIGLSKNTGSGLGALGVSALTGGLINPVIVKQVLFPMLNPLLSVTKTIASFPGLLPMLFRRVSGKTSSAVESDPDKRLHGKLDQILGAIKNKTKSSKVKEEKEQSMLSKFLNALLLGAAGMFAASEILGGANNKVLDYLKRYGPIMIAGYALGGWKGALVGFGLQVSAEALGLIETEGKPNVFEDAVGKINKAFGLDLKEQEFKGIVGGYLLGGWRGALVGFALTNKTFNDAVNDLRKGDFKNILGKIDRSTREWVQGTPLEVLPDKVIEGGIAGGAIGSIGGFKGLVVGALLGAAGGFVWDRYQNYAKAKENGFNTRFDFESFDFKLGKSDKTYSDYYESFLYKKNKKGEYVNTPKEAEQKAIAAIKKDIENGILDNSETSITSSFLDFASNHTLEIAGLAGLTTGIIGLSGLIDGTKLSGGVSIGLIAAIVAATFALQVKKNQENIDEAVDEDQEKHPERKVSDSYWGEAGKNFEEGNYLAGTQAMVSAGGAQVAEVANSLSNSVDRNLERGRAIDAVRRLGYLSYGYLAPEEEHKVFQGLKLNPMLLSLLSPYFSKEQLEKYNSMLKLEYYWESAPVEDIALASNITGILNQIKYANGEDIVTHWWGGRSRPDGHKGMGYKVFVKPNKITNNNSQKATIINQQKQQQIDDAQEKAQQKEAEEDENLKNNTDKTEANTIALQALTDAMKKPIVNFDGTYQTPITPGETYRDSNGNIRYRTSG